MITDENAMEIMSEMVERKYYTDRVSPVTCNALEYLFKLRDEKFKEDVKNMMDERPKVTNNHFYAFMDM